MNPCPFIARNCPAIVSRAAITLFALIAVAWSAPASGGEIHDAVRDGDLAKVQALLKGNPDLVFSKDSKTGANPLHTAALEGSKDVAESLLANNAGVNAKDNHGMPPLHWAAFTGRKDVVESLLARKADVNPKDFHGWTPLHFAAAAGNLDVAEFLLADQADVNAKDNHGKTPMHEAAYFGHQDVADLLRQHGGHE